MSRPGEGPNLQFAAALALIAVACHSGQPKPRPSAEETRRLVAELERRIAEKRTPHTVPPPSSAPEAEPLEEPSPSGSVEAPREPGDAPRTGEPWVVDTPMDVGPKGPATATPRGVLMNTKDGDLFVLRLGRLSRSPRSERTPLRPVPEGAGPFALGRGPALADRAVYWISHGSLVRRRLSARDEPGPLEILAKDAHDGTRVATPIPAQGRVLAKIPDAVAYVVRPAKEDGPLVAKLWVDGSPSETLTADGNSTHSVSLVQTDAGLLAISVQARMAITPVHARTIRFASGKPLLGEDTVVWVGGGIQPLTEMTILPSGERDLWGFLPHERSIKEFGIARLDIGMNPDMDTETTWLLYPNGIDPAPVATGHLCGEPVILYAAPETRDPDSSVELILRSVQDSSRWQRIDEGHPTYFTSLSEVEGGALAVWVTDEATRAATVRCTRARR